MSTESEKKPNIINDYSHYLSSATYIVALASISFFILGYTYILGYFAGFGLLLGEEQSEELTVFIGFNMFFELLPEVWNQIIRSFSMWQVQLVLVSFILIMCVLVITKHRSAIEKMHKVTSSKLFTWLILIPSVLFLLPLTTNHIGKRVARDIQKDIIEMGCVARPDGWNRCHHIYLKDKLIKQGFVVYKVKEQIILFDGHKRMIEYITLPQNAILTRKYTPATE